MAGLRAFNRESLNACPCLPSTGYLIVPIGATGAVGTLQQFKGNSVKSVTRNSAGNYTVVFNPPSLFMRPFILAQIHKAAVDDANVSISYDVGSYAVAANGETSIILFCSGVTALADTTVIAADPVDGSEIHLSWMEPRIKVS